MKTNIMTILFLLIFTCNHCINEAQANTQISNTSLSDYDKLKTYLHALSDTLSIENYDAIIFISDKEGSCLSSLKSFSNFVCQYILNQKRMLVILNAKGDQLQTSAYLSDTVKNVITDYSNDFFRLKITSSASSIIVLKDNTIDEIYPVETETLSDNIALLARMRHRINK